LDSAPKTQNPQTRTATQCLSPRKEKRRCWVELRETQHTKGVRQPKSVTSNHHTQRHKRARRRIHAQSKARMGMSTRIASRRILAVSDYYQGVEDILISPEAQT